MRPEVSATFPSICGAGCSAWGLEPNFSSNKDLKLVDQFGTLVYNLSIWTCWEMEKQNTTTAYGTAFLNITSHDYLHYYVLSCPFLVCFRVSDRTSHQHQGARCLPGRCLWFLVASKPAARPPGKRKQKGKRKQSPSFPTRPAAGCYFDIFEVILGAVEGVLGLFWNRFEGEGSQRNSCRFNNLDGVMGGCGRLNTKTKKYLIWSGILMNFTNLRHWHWPTVCPASTDWCTVNAVLYNMNGGPRKVIGMRVLLYLDGQQQTALPSSAALLCHNISCTILY